MQNVVQGENIYAFSNKFLQSLFFFLYIKHLHSKVKPKVTRHINIDMPGKKITTDKKDKTRAVTSYM